VLAGVEVFAGRGFHGEQYGHVGMFRKTVQLANFAELVNVIGVITSIS
jgi:hypothetical protein